MDEPPLVRIRGLSVDFLTPEGRLNALSDIDLEVGAGEVLGLVGESGSGKSLAMRAIMGLLPPRATASGSIRFRGQELITASERELRRLRGGRIAMIFQDPLTAFNPVQTIGTQIGEMLRLHNPGMSRRSIKDRTVELLELVSIPSGAKRLRSYPHEFSGGMRQRVMIAMALANNPEFLIADEPTTALDVTVQAQVLETLQGLQKELAVGLCLVTHDLGVVAGMADRVAVMYAGRIVEQAEVDRLFATPSHPYTRGLIGSVPRFEGRGRSLVAIEGAPPSLAARPPGCAFAPRCSYAQAACREQRPELRPVGAGLTACHFAEAVARAPADGETVA